MVTTFADLSHHQTADLAAYARAGHDRVVLKATEGTGFTDDTFADRWRQAGQLGLARVAYHYARNKFNGADEFDLLWRVVQGAGGLGDRDRLCLDTEDTETPRYAVREAQQFTARAVALGVTRGLVYTGNWYVKQVASAGGGALSASVFPAGWRQLWLSHYDASVPDDQIIIPNGWARSQCVARQYTDRATVAGVLGGCDYSRLFVEWLTTGPTEEETLAILTDDEKTRLMRAVDQINGAVGFGQTSFSTTIEATLAKVNNLTNEVRALASVTGNDEAVVLGALGEVESVLSAKIDATHPAPEPAPEPTPEV